MYSPITPRNSACTPPMKHTMHARLAQPATDLPISAAITAHMMPMKLSTMMDRPAKNTIRMGLTDRDVMPSKARASIFLRG